MTVTVEKAAQMLAAGYKIHQRSSHMGPAWAWRSPVADGKSICKSPEAAWIEAEHYFDREVERARELMKHLDLKAAFKTFFGEDGEGVARDWDYYSDGGSTWMIDATFEPDDLVTALIAAPMRPQS